MESLVEQVETLGLTEKVVETNGMKMRIVECGTGKPVIFCHGFPGLWYSWRHQLEAVARAGYRAIAVDQRGYGRSDRSLDVASYDANMAIADMIGLLDAIKEKEAIFVGHDFGAQQVCNLAVRFPERVAGVVIMSCPYDFDLAGRGGRGRNSSSTDVAMEWAGGMRPTEAFAMAAEKHFLHLHYLQAIGPAERELEPRAGEFLRRLFWALSSGGEYKSYVDHPSENSGYLDVLAPAPALPWAWMSEADMDYFITETAAANEGEVFVGGFNSYRAADRNWELGEEWADATIEVPALFVSGADDIVLKMIAPDALDIMKSRVPDLRGIHLIPNAGHFVQMEQPEEMNKALIPFFHSVEWR